MFSKTSKEGPEMYWSYTNKLMSIYWTKIISRLDRNGILAFWVIVFKQQLAIGIPVWAIAAESLMSATQILAILSKSFFKSVAVYFHRKKQLCDSPLHCYQYPVELELVSTRKSEQLVSQSEKIYITQKYFP